MKKLLMLAAGLTAATLATAETKPFQASLTPDIAVESSDTRIEGVALSIWGENPQKAFALGFVNGSTGDSVGFSLGLLNYSENYNGVQWGVANYSTGKFTGWQGAAVSYAEHMKGLQTSFVNYAAKLKGVQLGFVNYAETVDETAVQVGFLNLMPETKDWFKNFPDEVAPGMVLVNWRM